MKKPVLAVGVICLLGLGLLIVAMQPRGQVNEESLFPDPIQRTHARVREFAWMIDQFRSEQGRLPSNLEELLGAANQQVPTHFATDAWGNRITYETHGSTYEVRSIGEDGKAGTADDFAVGSR